MITTTDPARYKRHRHPSDIIAHAVWLYFRFSLSYRNVEELLVARGIHMTYETVRQWCRKFGQVYANQLRRRRPQPGDKWHNVLDILFTAKRESKRPSASSASCSSAPTMFRR
jgi:transposase-like protein